LILLLDIAVERLEVGGFLAANSSSPLFLLPFGGSLSLTALSTGIGPAHSQPPRLLNWREWGYPQIDLGMGGTCYSLDRVINVV